MPQAMLRLLATPMMRALFPSSSAVSPLPREAALLPRYSTPPGLNPPSVVRGGRCGRWPNRKGDDDPRRDLRRLLCPVRGADGAGAGVGPGVAAAGCGGRSARRGPLLAAQATGVPVDRQFARA